MNISCRNNVFESCHISEEANILESTSDTHCGDLVSLLTSEVLTIKTNLSSGDRVDACDHVEDCCLTGSIRTDKSADLALFD